MNNSDYPATRAHRNCPICVLAKPIGNLACWPCYRREDMRNGLTIKVAQTIRSFEWSITHPPITSHVTQVTR